MEIGNSRTKWFIIALFVIGFLVFFHFALGDVDLFFALMGVIVIASSIIFLTSRNFFKTLLGFVVVLALFAFGIWSSEKIDTAFAESQPPRQIEEIIIDGQDTSLIIPSESTEVASGEPLPTFTSGNCVSANFPESVRQWCPLIETSAAKYNIDSKLIASVMLQESGGNPHAGKTSQIINGAEYYSSEDGAIGLLQVMPRDGISANFQCPNGPCFGNRPSMEQLYDPEFNIEYGTKMLSGLIVNYGSAREGLFHYGPKDAGYTGYADLVLKIYETY